MTDILNLGLPRLDAALVAPSPPQREWKTDLEIGLLHIRTKRRHIEQRWAYYEGQHREKVLTPKFLDLAEKNTEEIASMFTNYCRLVVNAPLSRLKITGFKGAAGDVKEANDLWKENTLDLESEEIHRHALCAGEAFVVVWPRYDENRQPVKNAEGDPIYDIALSDARNTHVEYASPRRRDRLWALKCWLRSDGQWQAILYYPEQIIRLVGPAAEASGFPPIDRFGLDAEDPGAEHDFRAVPVIRFSRSWNGHSALDDVIPIQDRINKLTADKIVTAEFAAFAQRWALTNDSPPEEVMRAGAGAVWVLPPSSEGEDGESGNTSVGQFPASDLGNFDNTIAREVNAFFTVAQLPRHLLVDPGVAPTGEAIKADEGPMIAAVGGYQDMFSAAWQDVFTLCKRQVELVWKDIEVRNQFTQAQTFQLLVQGGMPVDLAATVALNLPQEQLDLLKSIPSPLQPGTRLLQQEGQPAPRPDSGQGQQGDQ